MNNKQVSAARKALYPYLDRVRIDVTRQGEAAVLVPYLISDPTSRGEPVVVSIGTGNELSIQAEVIASIGGILG